MLWWCFHFIWIFDLKLKKNTQNDFIVAFALCYLWMVSEKLKNLKVFRQFQFKRNGNCYLIENNGKWYTLETPFYPSTHIHRKHAFRRTRDDGKLCVVFISFYAIAPFVLMLVYHLSFHLHWSNVFFLFMPQHDDDGSSEEEKNSFTKCCNRFGNVLVDSYIVVPIWYRHHHFCIHDICIVLICSVFNDNGKKKTPNSIFQPRTIIKIHPHHFGAIVYTLFSVILSQEIFHPLYLFSIWCFDYSGLFIAKGHEHTQKCYL